jgi:polyisoprenoid-binding protein YceI
MTVVRRSFQQVFVPRIFFILGLILLSSFYVVPQSNPGDERSSVNFTVKYIGIPTHGSFSKVYGFINFDKNNLPGSNCDVTVDAKSISTENEVRDNHLRGADFFDATQYETMHFTSTKITATAQQNVFEITGQLTVKNKTKTISFPFQISTLHNGFVFKGEFRINREDFGVGDSRVISDNVDVSVTLITDNSAIIP